MTAQDGMLLDTNVFSELYKPRPNGHVLRFFEGLSPGKTYVSALTIGELRKGVAVQQRRSVAGATELSAWIDALEARYRENVLTVTLEIARIWGELSAVRSRAVVDTLLAATAIHHRLVLVTRNVQDVHDVPVTLHNPWLG